MKHRKDAPPLKALCQLVKHGRFAEAMDRAEGTEENGRNDEHGEGPLHQSALFWKGTMEQAAALEQYAASEFLCARWDEFSRSGAARSIPESYAYAIKEYVFNRALSGYLALQQQSGIADTLVLTRIGKLRQGLGDYELAIRAFEQARGRAPEDARITAALADCYELIGETRAAKLLFREAFFLDPAAIDLADIESSLILQISDELRRSGTPEAEIACWIPVWATVAGVFNVRRELKPVEIARLTHSISELERSQAASPSGRGRALLLNCYFWLADHYASIKAPKEDLDEVLRNIQQTDPRIYERYIH
jgi:tetratricopeptide (TPR) repeat protein